MDLKGSILFRGVLTLLFLLSLTLRTVDGWILDRTWKAGMPPCTLNTRSSMEAKCAADIYSLLPREALGSSASLVNSPLTFSLTTDSTFMPTTTTSTTTASSSSSNTVVPPPSFSTTLTRSAPSFTPTTTSTTSSTTIPVSTSTPSSSSETQSSSSTSMSSSSDTLSSSQSTSTQSMSSSTTSASSSASSLTSTSSTPPLSTSSPPPTSSSSSTATESQTSSSSSVPSSSSTQSMTGVSSTATQSQTGSPSLSPSSTQSENSSGSTAIPSHTSSSSSRPPTATSSSPSLTSPVSHASSMTSQSSSGGSITSTTSSASHSSSTVSGPLSDSSSSGTISSSLPSQSTQTFSTAMSTTGTTGSFSVTSSGSSAPPQFPTTGTGTGTDRSSSITRSTSSAPGSSSSAPASSSSGSGGTGSGSSAALSRQTHQSPFYHLVHSTSSSIPFTSFKRGMNVFGQRLELGETPAAWWRLAEPGNNTQNSYSREAGLGRTHEEEKQQHQTRTQTNDDNVPSSSEKRSVYAIAASIVGRVRASSKPVNYNKESSIPFSDEEKEGLKNNFEDMKRIRSGPILNFAASVVKHTYMSTRRSKYRSGSDDNELRTSEYPLPSSSSSTHPSPPSSHFSPSRNHTPFPFTFYFASNSSSDDLSISPVQDVPATASVTATDNSDENSYVEPPSRNRVDLDLDTEGQRGYIPIMRTDTHITTDSSSSSASGMEYISFMRRDTDTDSYIQTAPRTPSTRSLDLTRTHTPQSGNSDAVVSPPPSSPPPTRRENAFETSRVSLHSRHTQDTHDTRNTRSTYDTSTVETTSSLSFAQPKVIRTPASHGNDTTSKSQMREVPLITSTFHYSPDPEDEDDIALNLSSSANSSGFSSSSSASASKNPFHPSNPLFPSGPPYSNQNQEKEERDSFFRTLEWRRRAMAYADSTGQIPSLMEAVEVYFSSSSNSNTDSSPGSPAVDVHTLLNRG
ncbi:hypothetical protein J3R30DRAFT_3709500 [Lentinula aciculospora]|uniref:Uncharacterized protein n=1 Tax=Lentinula aciculospora TaxID=153920 RepID=A0A9W9DIH1_9AGAR|nr:hypothetical protein J3R30DRAFT_3709500 [Lentinula aciculospora]